MERALFDSRQSAAEKDKKIAHLEAKIGSTDTRGSQIFSPREDAPSPQKFEAPQISATLVREPKGPDLLPRASPHDWINYSAPERPSRRIHELQPACSVGDREISNRVPEISGGGGPGYVRAPPVPVRSGQYEDENTSESPYRIAAPAPLLPQRSTRPGGRSSPPAAVAPHAPLRYSPPQFQYRQQQGAMQHLSNPAPSERGGMGGAVMNSNTNAKNYHQQVHTLRPGCGVRMCACVDAFVHVAICACVRVYNVHTCLPHTRWTAAAVIRSICGVRCKFQVWCAQQRLRYQG